MSYLGSYKLKKLIESEGLIQPLPDAEELAKRINCGAFELSLGDEVYHTDSIDSKKQILTQDKEQVIINPGQFALLLTAESVKIPVDKIAFISIRAGIKLRGLVNVSGFHVDPGFEGKLLFSVYNAGSGSISLERGSPYFLIWFAELDMDDMEKDQYEGKHQGQSSIPLKYVDALNSSELASPNVLLQKINENYQELNSKATNRHYIYRTGIGILVVIAVKLFLDWSTYSKGVDDGYKRKGVEVGIDSTINSLLDQKRVLLLEVQRLEANRSKTIEVIPKKKQNDE